MQLLPKKQVTIVLPFPIEDVYHRLSESTVRVGFAVPEKAKVHQSTLFNGNIGNSGFSISRKIDTPNNFVPLISGKIEPTRSGSIIFMRYEMFRSTKIFIIAWTLITLFCTLIFSLVKINHNYAMLSASLLVLNYLIAIGNFHRQVKFSQEAMNKVLFKTEKF